MAVESKTDPRPGKAGAEPRPAFDPTDPHAPGLPPGVFFVRGRWVRHDGSDYTPTAPGK